MSVLLRQLAILMVLAALPASVSAFHFWNQGKGDAFLEYSVPISEVLLWKKPVLWVDARSASDYAIDHVPGAMRLTEDDWDELLPELLQAWEPERVTVVYCSSRTCHTSEEVAKRLREVVGLKPVYVLRGGWKAWKKAGK